MGKYILLLIVLLAAGFFLLKGNLNKQNSLIKEKGFFIRTDETQYTRGGAYARIETVTIFFINNTTTTKQTMMGNREYAIQKKDGETWVDVANGPCWEGSVDQVFEAPAPLVYQIKAGRTGKLTWDQMERRCETIGEMRKLEVSHVASGIYRIWSAIGNEDGSSAETVMSNEFEILPQ